MPKGIATAQHAARLARTEGLHRVGPGLYLRVRGRSAIWTVRVTLAGRAREYSLGAYQAISLADALAQSAQLRLAIKRGDDPRQTRAKEQSKPCPSFREFAERHWESLRHGWRNPKHAAQWINTLRAYAYPMIGDLRLDAIETRHILAILEPIWLNKHETAMRVRQRIENVLAAARVRGYRQGENPAAWHNHLDVLLPAVSRRHGIRHHPALPWRDMPAFMAELAAHDSISSFALRFLILTAARTGEVTGATWDEIDNENWVWTVPAARMKAGRAHRVPLSAQAADLLVKLPRLDGSPWVFPSSRTGRPLSNMAMLELLRGLRPGLTVHGFRSSFRDWVSEATDYSPELAEMALAHVIPNRTEAAYRRGDLLERRRELMQAWADYCLPRPSSSEPG